jgi:hypothetical protein
MRKIAILGAISDMIFIVKAVKGRSEQAGCSADFMKGERPN